MRVHFQGDELTLGRANKNAIGRFIEEFNIESDRILISGCRNRDDQIGLRRIYRMRDELITHGLSNDSIKNAKCADKEYEKELKPGMVILAHQKPTIPNI